MNWDTVEGKWDYFRGTLRDRWAMLSNDDVTSLGAKKDKLVGKIQERYGILKDEAERQVDSWLASLNK